MYKNYSCALYYQQLSQRALEESELPVWALLSTMMLCTELRLHFPCLELPDIKKQISILIPRSLHHPLSPSLIDTLLIHME